MNQTHLQRICHDWQLGSPVTHATKVEGGRGGHLMWRIQTDKGCYCLKQLAPDLDLSNANIIAKYELSESIAYQFSQHGILAAAAIAHAGKYLGIYDETGYLVYPWIDGYTLQKKSASHAVKIAEVIAKLHHINLDVPQTGEMRFDIHQNSKIVTAIDNLAAAGYSAAAFLKENERMILSRNDHYQAALPLLKEREVVTHGDVHQGNIIWNDQEQAVLIDWESARKMNPALEIIRTSLAWSGIGGDDFSVDLYKDMLAIYNKTSDAVNKCDLNTVFNALFGGLINRLMFDMNIVSTSHLADQKDKAITEMTSLVTAMLNLQSLSMGLIKATKQV